MSLGLKIVYGQGGCSTHKAKETNFVKCNNHIVNITMIILKSSGGSFFLWNNRYINANKAVIIDRRSHVKKWQIMLHRCIPN